MTTAQSTDPRPLAGEPLALDLLNTVWLPSGNPVDLLATAEDMQAWLAAAGVEAKPVSGTREALVQSRQAIRDVMSGQDGIAALDRLNAVLDHGHVRLAIGPPMNPQRTLEVADPAWRPAVMAAASLLDLLAEAPDRIRRCQNPSCVLWFYDTTRNRTRRWCSMAVCGNRAKARRHYDRVKSTVSPPAASRAQRA